MSRVRGLSQGRRRLPLPPDLREEMKKALRKVVGEQARRRGEVRRVCKGKVEAAKKERNAELARLDEEYGQRAAAIRSEFEAKAAKRLVEAKVAAATGEESHG